ncbi:cation-translocating P-type ATPase [Mycolicibacterium sp. CBMA 226]|uniref:cation-translocating P-type ATPase n=1 Tax=Mycolicibacterium sp. CBMA 226 TaxID=2606611 RepID=UPI001FB6C34F|nr:cation-translocating P-type ATPase [Mycolicibacterium sp. CBMA 226]
MLYTVAMLPLQAAATSAGTLIGLAEASTRATVATVRPRPGIPEGPPGLPASVLAAAANSLGAGVAVAGRALRLPALPASMPALVIAIDYQPQLRRALENRLGTQSTETLLALAGAASYTLSLAPGSLAVNAAVHIFRALELQAAQAVWRKRDVACETLPPPVTRPRPLPPGPVERYCDRSALAQAAATGVVGAAGGVDAAAAAVMVTAPKAARYCREVFAAALGRALAREHGVLTLNRDALRRLDRVDAVVFEPETLQDNGSHDPLAAALLDEARSAGVEVIALDTDDLGELRPRFDELKPAAGESAFVNAITELQAEGRTVAAVTTASSGALAAADIAIALQPNAGPTSPHAHLVAPDLLGVWRILHAVRPARQASRRGVELAAAASLLGALLMVPGVRGRGPGPITAGAGAAVWSGYRHACRVLHDGVPSGEVMHEWHAMSADQVRTLLPAPGDSDVPAQRKKAPRRPLSGMAAAVRHELADPLTPVLAVGATASAILGSPVDAILVGSVLTGNAVLAATQRLRAERLLRRLLAVQRPPARIRIGSSCRTVSSDAIRPGHVIAVYPGEVVPADARLLEATDLEVDESALTGESLPVEKSVGATPGAPLADRACMIHAGTTVVAGAAVGVVTEVGNRTQVHRAAALGSTAHDPGDVGLQHQLRDLTNRAWPASVAGGTLVGLLGLLKRDGLRSAVGSAVAVSVAAVPEGLPLVATLAQQASARRLTEFGALVRSSPAVEALGRVDVVCFDKTGTLSMNRLQLAEVIPQKSSSRADVIRSAGWATPPANGDGHEHATDAAVAEVAADHGVGSDGRSAVLPFRSGRPYSAALVGRHVYVKGAPEAVMAACSGDRRRIRATVKDMAAQGLRVLAVAGRELTEEQATNCRDAAVLETYCAEELSVVGFVGLADTPRPEAADLLTALAERDIDTRIITGDHPVTAAAIAQEMGLSVEPADVITGTDWEALSRRDQEKAVGAHVVFARMSPEHKVQIVETLERSGRVCAMVGDGANDAAAIRAASIGVGVVAAGSDPARTAADVMLTDGRITALLDAVDEGRQLWRRVQAAVSVLLGGNAGEILFAVLGTGMTGRSPLSTRQLLVVNLLTDALPAAALAVSAPTESVSAAGRGPDQAALWRTVGLRGVTTALAATAAWWLARLTGRRRRASTVGLVALVAAQLGQTLLDSHGPLVVATAAGSLVALGALISTPVLSQLLGNTPLGPVGWAQALAPAAAAVLVAGLMGRRQPCPT